MNRILFVDDEEAVLSGIRDLLRKERRRWEMVFALGAERALAEMESKPCDLIISDMRMPGMDGAELLRIVKERYPGTARIVLSGYADRDGLIRAMHVTQQFLSKPCDGLVLKGVIERTFDLQQLLNSEFVRVVVGKVEHLPTVPAIYSALWQASEDPDVSLADIAALVEKEPSISAKLLQLVNSCCFGTGSEITSIAKAVGHLGVDLLKRVVLATAGFNSEFPWPSDGISLHERRRHSWMAAQLAKKFLPDVHSGDQAFTASLLHGVGVMILAQAHPMQYGSVIRAAQEEHRPVHEVERERFGTTHAEVGAYLLGMWGLPYAIVECVAHHLEPSRVTTGSRAVLAAGHVAVALVNQRFRLVPPPVDRIDRRFLADAGMLDQLDGWLRIAETEFAMVEKAA